MCFRKNWIGYENKMEITNAKPIQYSKLSRTFNRDNGEWQIKHITLQTKNLQAYWCYQNFLYFQ